MAIDHNKPPEGDFYRQQAQLRTEAPDHEHSDVDIRGVIIFVVVLLASAVIIHFVLWFFYGFLVRQAGAADPEPHALVQVQPDEVSEQQVQRFPEPRLQPNEVMDMYQLRRLEETLVNSYVWIDQKAGRVSLPIDRAMDLLVERGLPHEDLAPSTTPLERAMRGRAAEASPAQRQLPAQHHRP